MLKKIVFVVLVCMLALSAADVTGKYVGEAKMSFQGQERVMKLTLDLKADGAKVTGTLLQEGGMGKAAPTPTEIKDGKVDGNKVTFNVERPGRDGNVMKTEYSATLDGTTLKGSSKRDFGGQVMETPFELKKQ